MYLTGFFPGQILSEKAKHRSYLNLSQQGLLRISDIINSSRIPRGEEEFINKIDLDYNNITELDSQTLIEVFPNLQTIALRNNQINQIGNTGTIYENKLLKLDLCKNWLKLQINRPAFVQFSVLTHLYLCENGIGQIPDNTFKGLKQLEFLDLQKNKIFSLQFSWFNHLKNLETLDLSYNMISTWIPEDFLWQKKLNWLVLKGNQLKSLPPLPVRSGWSTNLMGNEIFCGCHLPSHEKITVSSSLLVHCSNQEEISLGYHGSLLHFVQQHTPICEKPSVKFVTRRINGKFLMTCTAVGVPVPHQIGINTSSGSIIKHLSTKITPVLTLIGIQEEQSAKCTARSLIGVSSAETHVSASYRAAADVGTTTSGKVIGLSIFTLLTITLNIAVAIVAFWAVTVNRSVPEEQEISA